MSTFADFIPCIHGGLRSTCAICTGTQKLMLRYNPNIHSYELFGFFKGSNPVRWGWIAVNSDEADRMLKNNKSRFMEVNFDGSGKLEKLYTSNRSVTFEKEKVQ